MSVSKEVGTQRINVFIDRFERSTGVLRSGPRGAFYGRVDPRYARTLKMIEGEDIALEGVPAVGKSTLIRSLGAALTALGASVKEYPEERDEGMLNDFFSDPPGKGFGFQMFKLRGRQHICSELLHTRASMSESGGVAKRVTRLLDRMLAGDMAFAFWNYAVGNFTDAQLNLYMEYATKIRYPTPFLTVYLRADPARLVQNVKVRGNAAEMAFYTEDYFRLMDACHEIALELSGCSYCIVDWNAEDEGVGVHADALVKPNVPLERCMEFLENAISAVYKRNIDRIESISDNAHVDPNSKLLSRFLVLSVPGRHEPSDTQVGDAPEGTVPQPPKRRMANAGSRFHAVDDSMPPMYESDSNQLADLARSKLKSSYDALHSSQSVGSDVSDSASDASSEETDPGSTVPMVTVGVTKVPVSALEKELRVVIEHGIANGYSMEVAPAPQRQLALQDVNDPFEDMPELEDVYTSA